MKKEKNFFTKWLLCLLFTSYVTGISFFTHSTVIDGVVYVHSHPFKAGERHTHEHSKEQLLLLEQFYQTTITSEIIPDIDLTDHSSAFTLFYACIRNIFHTTGAANNTQLRAPPVFKSKPI
jgi:hypothetical protein